MTTTSLSLVSLALALYAWLLAYAFAMSPSTLPCLDFTQPMPVCCGCPKSRFSSSAPHFAGHASERDTVTCQDRRGECLARSPLIPPRFPYYNFVCTDLFLFVCWCVVQVSENNHLLGGLNARGQTAVFQRSLPPQTLSSLSYVIWSAFYVSHVSWFCLFLFFCARFLINFLVSLSFLA